MADAGNGGYLNIYTDNDVGLNDGECNDSDVEITSVNIALPKALPKALHEPLM